MKSMSKPTDQTLLKFVELARYIAAQADQTLTLDILAPVSYTHLTLPTTPYV